MSLERESAVVSWHDNLIYALHIRAPDADARDWRSELILDIDHIVEWICAPEGKAQFRVAPATLVFHDVTDLVVRLDMSGAVPLALNEWSIAAIGSSPAPHPGQAPALPYYRWRIALNLPSNGEIAFGASGYTQTLRAEPVLTDNQRLPATERPGLLRINPSSGYVPPLPHSPQPR